MSHSDRLTTFAEQAGFSVIDDSKTGVLTAEGVPCLLAGGTVSTCAIATSYDIASRRPTDELGGAVHAVRITIAEESDGLVYQADGTVIGNQLAGDGKTWSTISIQKGWIGQPEKDATASDLIHRYAKRIVGAVAKAGYSDVALLTKPGPFHIPNTFEARAGVASIQDRIRQQSVAIIGLGGTGAYLLDLVAKTPVRAIHIVDSDYMDWHNFMRAPGAPTRGEMKLDHEKPLLKVDYYHSKYTAFRDGIHPHPVRVDSLSMFAEFLSAYPIDFAFVCIDQLTEGDAPRQDVVYTALAAVPFIDSGVSISVEKGGIRGAITTSIYDTGSMAWQEAIPNARMRNGGLGYRNVQLPEVNALAASLAVMEWRRHTEQYASEDTSFLHKFRLETPRISAAPQ